MWVHTHYLFITLWISIWFLSIIKLCCSISNIPCPITSNICRCPARAVLAAVLKKEYPFLAHSLDPGLPLHLLLQLDFPSQAPDMPSPLDFQITTEMGISRKICTWKFANAAFFPEISKGRSPQPGSEMVGDNIYFTWKTAASGNWLNTDMGGLTVKFLALPE